ncbi:metalloregulator ArsR/SmtB family transcription factor [Phytohabitans sp. ZYX-F-186]|uniref:Metalloregulator ArsR/SmtB family transcription factor n=1 Tax=Phytohabitans maris TaxID=3071409 RepID=A0ABU0ZGJ1_9ACTN|nr:metalloregulator ArsR/SmtB family transcription factor [Phytohabitans sp. ZYX-F-186]MDQ7906113.1 metalloregulator ArsR/SmtB family transcription factor [Phytohabitans sp. ZYX-F-186]
MDDVFKALADPSRRRLLDRLNERNGQTLQELCAGLAMARQSVSKHLAVLEAAGLVATERRGREKLHFLDAGPINAIADRWMTRYDRARAAALTDLKHALEEQTMDDRFVYTTYIRSTPERTWEALTDPAFTKRYWGVALRSDWRVGSTITWELEKVTVADGGSVVLAAEPPRTLSYTWHTVTPEFVAVYGDDQEFLRKASAERRSKVTFDIEPHGDLVKLTVTHDDFDPGSVVLGGVTEGWPPILSSLKSLLETGEPLPVG